MKEAPKMEDAKINRPGFHRAFLERSLTVSNFFEFNLLSAWDLVNRSHLWWMQCNSPPPPRPISQTKVAPSHHFLKQPWELADVWWILVAQGGGHAKTASWSISPARIFILTQTSEGSLGHLALAANRALGLSEAQSRGRCGLTQGPEKGMLREKEGPSPCFYLGRRRAVLSLLQPNFLLITSKRISAALKMWSLVRNSSSWAHSRPIE